MQWIVRRGSQSTDDAGEYAMLLAFELVVGCGCRDGHETKCNDYGLEHQSTDIWFYSRRNCLLPEQRPPAKSVLSSGLSCTVMYKDY
jgi:hypothetical protein